MQTRTCLLSLTLAASASAALLPVAVPTATPAPLVGRRPSDSDSDSDSFCTSAASSFTANEPALPTGALSVWLNDNDALQSVQSAIQRTTTIDDVEGACSDMMEHMNTASPPASLASAFSSYTSRYNSWQSSMAPTASSIAARCTGTGVAGLVGVGIELYVATDVPQCTSALDKYNANSVVERSASAASPGYRVALAGLACLAAGFALFC